MKKSLLLIELIFSIVILSIIFLTTNSLITDIYKKNKTNFDINITKLEFETTKLFLTKTLKTFHNLNKISYKQNNLYFENNLLQKRVTSFVINKQNNLYKIDICIKISKNICQKWIIK
jgi:hypothetical protein